MLLVAASLCLLMVATTLPMTAEYDPSRPSSSTGKGGSQPPGDGGGGGGDTGGGDAIRKVALGLATPLASIADLDALTASIGKKPAIWVLWSQWGSRDGKAFPTATAAALKDRNIQPMIWWEPVDPAQPMDPTYPRHKNISAGNHDPYIRQWARDARDFGGTVLLRFAHEINNNYFPWSINEFDNSPATFKDAWRHVVDIFREEGASNVKFVWSIVKKTCSGGCNPYTEVYPGDAYVDIMGFTAYNWGSHPGKTWNPMYDSFRMVTRKLREVSDKPIMAAETASNGEGGDKAAWIRDGYRKVYAELPDVEAIVYLNADLRSVGHPDWRLASPAAALTAYAEIAALSKFDTRSPFGAGANKRAKTGDRTRKATKQQTAAAAPRNREPKVRNGNAASDSSKDPKDSRARKRTNKVTKKPKEDQEPPAVLDSFGR